MEEEKLQQSKVRLIEALTRKRGGNELARDLKAEERRPNETIEAYTGHHVARKGDRTPPGLIQPRYEQGESLKSRWRWC